MVINASGNTTQCQLIMSFWFTKRSWLMGGGVPGKTHPVLQGFSSDFSEIAAFNVRLKPCILRQVTDVNAVAFWAVVT